MQRGDIMESKFCEDCKHWTRCADSGPDSRIGICSKIPEGTVFKCEDIKFVFSGKTTDLGDYTDIFNCFEERDK